jgi:hypothetical protein
MFSHSPDRIISVTMFRRENGSHSKFGSSGDEFRFPLFSPFTLPSRSEQFEDFSGSPVKVDEPGSCDMSI